MSAEISGIRFCRASDSGKVGDIPLTAIRVLDASVKAECEPMGFKVGEVWFMNPSRTPLTQDQLDTAQVTLSDLVDHCRNESRLANLLPLFENFDGKRALWLIQTKKINGGVVVSGIIGYQDHFDAARKEGLVKVEKP